MPEFEGQPVDDIIAQAVDHFPFWKELVTTYKEKASKEKTPDFSTLEKISKYVGSKKGGKMGKSSS